MIKPDALLARLCAAVPGCIAAMLISVEEGGAALVAGEALDAGSLDAVAAAGRDLFAPGVFAEDTREMVVLSDERTYVYRRLALRPGLIVAAICRNTSNLGLVLGMVRQELDLLAGER
jgi:NAD(P)H-nitrite reductase large subunit